MSSSRYPDSRYPRDRERSPFRDRDRDRRPSVYGSTYPPRGGDSSRPNPDSSAFPAREVPRGPKALGDPPRGQNAGPPPGVPSGPRDGRPRPSSLRDAPPLSTSNNRDQWRADRDRDRDRERERERDRDFERRERRPSPRARSPIRDTRDAREFPRDLDINRARRNSRDGPPSAGSTYSDPPLGSASSYRGSGIGRGRGGRDFSGDFRGRGRGGYHDERDRHHDVRDRMPDRSYRPRSRSRDPVRRERDIRDDRDFDRRDRDDRRFDRRDDDRRGYDSYVGPGSSLKQGMRPLETHRGSVASDSRHIPGTPTGSLSAHPTHHSATGDRLGPPSDSFSRRSSIATEPLSAKEGRRETDKDHLLASRVEASKARYEPRASSPPAAVPAFGFSSNVWRNPALDTKSVAASQIAKAVPPATTSSNLATVQHQATAPPAPTAVKLAIPSGLAVAPPTGPKADRLSESQHQDKSGSLEQARNEPVSRPAVASATTLGQSTGAPLSETAEPKPTAPALVNSPPLGPGARPRGPPTGPQAALRPNASPIFSRPPQGPFAARDASPSAIPSGPRNPLSINTSPKSGHISIPTGPKADRTSSMSGRQTIYGPPDRPPFAAPRMPGGIGPPKSNQWVRPGLNSRPSTIPAKRELPNEDRDRPPNVTAQKAPKMDSSVSAPESQRLELIKSEAVPVRPINELENAQESVSTAQTSPKATPPNPSTLETRRLSDVSMADVSPRTAKPPVSAASSAPEVMEDSDDDLDLDEADFAESEAKYNREKAILESQRIDLSAPHLRATTPLQEIMLLASLTIDHLPQQEPKPVDEEMDSPLPVDPPAESTTTDLPTPRAEETEDVVMEEKPLAPATLALRQRRGTTPESENNPDLSTLPYLVSAPPTPVSDPDLPEAVVLAIRNSLKKENVPEMDPVEALEQYAIAYKNWRLAIRELDDERDTEDPERQVSAEPGVKVTTPDIQSSAMAALMDAPPTSRRGHRGFATELDIEHAIKESLRTAEEEKLGKKEREPRKTFADPEKEAALPLELTTYEAQRRRFIDTNFQREPGQGVLVFHYEPPEDDFTEDEHKIMVHHYRDQYAKKWSKLAEMLYKEAGTSRTYKDCINHYYATKWAREYKGKIKRRGGARKRGGGASRGRGVAANIERNDMEDGPTPLALTETGRPRRSAAPTFGAEPDLDANTPAPTPGRARRGVDAEGAPEKANKRGRGAKEKAGRKAKNQPLAAAPAGSPVKQPVPKDKPLGVKMEEDFGKHMTLPMQPGFIDEPMVLSGDGGLTVGLNERMKAANAPRPGPSSYWSVQELNDFPKYIAHFGTDWAAIASHMGTKTQTMVKNQFLRLAENDPNGGLRQKAEDADQRRNRGEDPGPPPAPAPAPKRRFDPSPTTLPRTLAPTPEVEMMNSAGSLPLMVQKSPPPHFGSNPRFSTIAPQTPAPTKVDTSAAPSVSMSESPLVSIPATSQQQSPPAQILRAPAQHQQQPPHIQHKPQNGPRAGYFSDDFPSRPENRPATQPATVGQHRSIQQQLQPHSRGSGPDPSPYRGLIHPDREAQARLEAQQEHDMQSRFQPQHSRRISQEMPHHRPFQTNVPSATQMLQQGRPVTNAGSPESRPLSLQHPRNLPTSHISDVSNQSMGSITGTPQSGSRPVIRTPPVTDDARGFQVPQSQPAQVQAPTQPFQPPHPPSTQASAPIPPPPKPAEPKKSSLLSLLNDPEPEEPRRKKPSDHGTISHTPTPQQQTSIAPPPPLPQGMPPRRDIYGEHAGAQVSYNSRPSYSQQPSQQSAGRQVVDLTHEASTGLRHQPRDPWQRPSFHPPQSQAQSTGMLNSPHIALAQPGFGDSRLPGNHRSVFAPHNTPRHNPSPPPHAQYSHSPQVHSRTPSLTHAPSQASRLGMTGTPPIQPSQPSSSAQILQPNPYAQVDPPGTGSQSNGTLGMRPSPHLHTSHIAQQRDLQSRNEQSQAHNANVPYSSNKSQGDLHSVHQHLRGPSMAEQHRIRDPRDIQHEFDARNRERDVARELSQRSDGILRERHDPVLASAHIRPGVPASAAQDLRYQPPSAQDRYGPPRAHTPLSRSEHPSRPSLQHPGQSLLTDPGRSILSQRQQEDPMARRYIDPYAPRDERERYAAEQEARFKYDETVRREREERDARYQDLQRRDSTARLPQPPLPPPPSEHQHRPGGPPMDWASAVRQPGQPGQHGWRER